VKTQPAHLQEVASELGHRPKAESRWPKAESRAGFPKENLNKMKDCAFSHTLSFFGFPGKVSQSEIG
jgi:hypothetical protein